MGFIRVIYANDRKIMAIRANTAKYGSLTEKKQPYGVPGYIYICIYIHVFIYLFIFRWGPSFSQEKRMPCFSQGHWASEPVVQAMSPEALSVSRGRSMAEVPYMAVGQTYVPQSKLGKW